MVGQETRMLRPPDPARRVGITGLGVVSPVGNDKETVWRNLLEGVSGIAEISRFDASPYEHRAAGEVRGFDPSVWMNPKAARRTDRLVQFAVAVAKQALLDAGLEITEENACDVGVMFGSGAGGTELLIKNLDTFRSGGRRAVSPFFMANFLCDAAAGVISIETGARGINLAIASACGTGGGNSAGRLHGDHRRRGRERHIGTGPRRLREHAGARFAATRRGHRYRLPTFR
jgi:3-oxoacyl-[acyl-carrier-protein] synthase II